MASAGTHAVDLAEVAQALFAPSGLRYERAVGDLLLIVIGMADTGRVVAVLCDRIGGSQTYKIVDARALRGAELDEWRRRVQ